MKRLSYDDDYEAPPVTLDCRDSIPAQARDAKIGHPYEARQEESDLPIRVRDSAEVR